MNGLTVSPKTLGIQATTRNIGTSVTFDKSGLVVSQDRYGINASGTSGNEGDYSVYFVFDDSGWILFDDGESVNVG